MRVVVVGATGYIGRSVVAALLTDGQTPVLAVRNVELARRRFPECDVFRVDLARDHDPDLWRDALPDADAVVNCAGVLERDADAVHVRGTGALFQACVRFGVAKVVHVSAISATGAAGTDYAESKLASEAALKALDLEWTILRPSLVYGAGAYGGTALMRGLAALPLVTPTPGDGRQTFSPIWLEDLSKVILLALEDDRFAHTTLEPCGPETVTFAEYLRRQRAWLGLPPARTLPIPLPMIRMAGVIGSALGLGPMSKTSVAQIEHGNAGDGAAFASAIGFQPLSMAEALARNPASGQDKQAARSYFLAWLVAPTVTLSVVSISLGAMEWGWGWTAFGAVGPALLSLATRAALKDDR